MKLVIVESPTKAKTIKKFLGKGFDVQSSYGHVRDLPKSKIGIDVESDFTPQYVITKDAADNIADLKKRATKADEIILATDEDREGEAIAWHLVHALELEGTKKELSRIVFHEITEEAIQAALASPRALDNHLIDAQQARRILDRLVGYELSPLLWRKIYRGLSAGRVQSVAVRFIVEREREIQAFKPQEYWTIDALFHTTKKEALEAKLHAVNGKTLDKFAFGSETEAKQIHAALSAASYSVAKVTAKKASKKAPTPFTTSLLQQEASRKLSFSPRQTMRLAQQLYEGVKLNEGGATGLITYMRTDSMNLSKKFLTEAKKYIEGTLGKDYVTAAPRTYKSKAKGAQEAHEAIRPTEVSRHPDSLADVLDARQLKLYRLIWQRAVASQLPDAEVETTSIDIAAEGTDVGGYTFRSSGSVVTFDGWRAIYPTDATDELLPKVETKDRLDLKSLTPTQHFTEPPARYSEATLIKALEEFGIGRPSTYAPTISTVQDRGYVERQERRLHPTELAFLVNDLLVEHFPKIVDFEFTANLEEQLDDIAAGSKAMVPVLRDFYTPFKKNLEVKEETLSKQKLTEEATDEKCEKCEQPMVIKLGRFGKFMACTGYPDCKTTKPLPGSEEAQKTDEACEKCGKPMQVKRGRFGTFLGCTGYPDCKTIKKIEKKTGVSCPECNKGDIVEKRAKKTGRNFYACNKYPDCEFSLWSKPNGEQCPTCQALLVYGAKDTIRCSSKECKFTKDVA